MVSNLYHPLTPTQVNSKTMAHNAKHALYGLALLLTLPHLTTSSTIPSRQTTSCASTAPWKVTNLQLNQTHGSNNHLTGELSIIRLLEFQLASSSGRTFSCRGSRLGQITLSDTSTLQWNTWTRCTYDELETDRANDVEYKLVSPYIRKEDLGDGGVQSELGLQVRLRGCADGAGEAIGSAKVRCSKVLCSPNLWIPCVQAQSCELEEEPFVLGG